MKQFHLYTLALGCACLLQASIIATAQPSNAVEEHLALPPEISALDVFRDGASVEWKSLSADYAGDVVVARTFSPSERPQVTWAIGLQRPQSVEAEPRPVDWYSEGDREQFEELKLQIQEIEADLAMQSSLKELAAEDLLLLKANRSISGTNEPLLTDDLDDMALWYHDKVKALLFRGLELDEVLVDLRDEIQELKKAQALVSSRRAWEWVVHIAPDAPMARNSIVLTARVATSQSSWAPQSKAELTGDKLVLERVAAIRLRVPFTGAHAPVLHDAAMGTSIAPATASTWRISTRAAYRNKGARSQHSAQAMGAPSAVASRGDGAESLDLEAVPFESSSSHSRASYHLNEALSLDMMQTAYRSISEVPVQFSAVRIATPREAAGVSIRLGVDRAAWGTLSTNAAVECTVDGRFHGKSWPVAVGDSVFIMVGLDRAWTVDRLLVETLSGTKGMGVRSERHLAYRLTVRNNSDRTGKVLLEESIPLAASDDINIEVLGLDGGARDAETGVVSWGITLEPGAHRTVQISYTINYPRGKVLTGI
ncbi:MAG: DUF4139 domain-containing protein [Flavobacteriales bacterium]|nr:DUF4139 domain-containing protein [Flavobacteriales bacterium]